MREFYRLENMNATDKQVSEGLQEIMTSDAFADYGVYQGHCHTTLAKIDDIGGIVFIDDMPKVKEAGAPISALLKQEPWHRNLFKKASFTIVPPDKEVEKYGFNPVQLRAIHTIGLDLLILSKEIEPGRHMFSVSQRGLSYPGHGTSRGEYDTALKKLNEWYKHLDKTFAELIPHASPEMAQ